MAENNLFSAILIFTSYINRQGFAFAKPCLFTNQKIWKLEFPELPDI